MLLFNGYRVVATKGKVGFQLARSESPERTSAEYHGRRDVELF